MRGLQGKRRRRKIRRLRLVGKVAGTGTRPRLSVYRSLKHIYAQLIDDEAGRTLASVSTRTAPLRADLPYGGNRTAAARVGKALAEKALGMGITQVRFDRGGCKYHGRVKALAEAAREAGLSF